ncbi:NADH dehydrogenase [Sulfurovum sp. TSL6]|uniref:2Fe-2S iron-sulfur cluster-binding protein n=1 Tax=Sulfurovum sp. TSL6 TaxID=2826995 RepID=UPI001CC338C6|nr:2Fe-2S iron-sulfur cluster-binding protein [Sulfurovum sp. TSL6]GIU00325.1 NADH dehydrogenase [Sulfurovum sp. TSL6]
MKIMIDNTPIECEENELLIDVMLNNNIHIPHFCYHQDLGADGNCRMCMVEIKGQKRPQIACDTLVKENLEVSTKSENITEIKRSILELELLNHPVDCPICDQAGECKLQDYYMDYGLYESHLSTPKTKKGKHIDLGSNVILDQERCVLCTRCTRFTSDITKTGELGIIGRGDSARVAVAPGRELHNPYAMNVVELCPVGALTSKDFRFKQRVWFLDSAESICHGCSRGCNIHIDYNETKYAHEKIHRFRARRNTQINQSFLCDYGRLSYKELNESFSGTVSEIKEFKALLTMENKLALVSPSMSLQQLQSVKSFCQTYDIDLFSLAYMDENFGDDWLRTNDLSANFTGVKELNINSSKEAFETSLENAEVVINFDHDLLKHQALHHKRVVQFTTSNCDTHYELIFAIANFAHDNGTIINCDGIRQDFYATKYKSETPTLVELLGELV